MKTRKFNFLHILLMMGLIVLPISCDKEAFLEEDLRDALSPATFYNNDAEAELAVNGVMMGLISNNGHRNRQYASMSHYGSDEGGPSRGNVAGTYHNYLYEEGVGGYGNTWRVWYQTIRDANSALENIEGNDKLSRTFRDQAIGQLLTIRALIYWELTVMWGDVPYFRDLPSSEVLGSIERTPVATIRTDLKSDLERAASLLPSEWSGVDYGRFTKWAALGFKTKIHLYDKEWAKTVATANQIINGSPHALMDNFEDVYGRSRMMIGDPQNKEMIAWIDFAGLSGQGVMPGGDYARNSGGFVEEMTPRGRDEPKNKADKAAFNAALAANGDEFNGFGAYSPFPDAAKRSRWQDDDLRYDVTIITHYEGFELKHKYFKKLWQPSLEASYRGERHENFILLRLADVYLMAAEAQNELAGPGQAYQFINKVRERAFEPDNPLSGLAQTSFREALQEERFFELMGEHQRKRDLIRWGLLADRIQNTTVFKQHNARKVNYAPRHHLLPIPLEEIQNNPNLLNTDPTNNGYR